MTFEEFKKEELKKPEVRAEYDALEEEFSKMQAEIEADEWDKAMITEAERENDGSTVSFEELLEEDGLTYEDLEDAAIADEAYEEYIESGKKSSPISELWKECGLED